jgi:hypothetical protein
MRRVFVSCAKREITCSTPATLVPYRFPCTVACSRNSPPYIRACISSRVQKWYAMPCTSPRVTEKQTSDHTWYRLRTCCVLYRLRTCVPDRGALVVWLTEKPNLSGKSLSSRLIKVPFPAPDGPQTTRGGSPMTGFKSRIDAKYFKKLFLKYFVFKKGCTVFFR